MQQCRRVVGVLGAVLSALVAGPGSAGAQAAPAGFVQLGVGGGSSSGGPYADRAEFTVEALGARRLSPSPLSGFGVLGALVVDYAISSPPGTCASYYPNGACAPTRPKYAGLAALVGVEARGAHGSVDVLVGPAVFVSAPSTAVGGMVRVDLAARLTARLALVLSPSLNVLVQDLPGATSATSATLRLQSLQLGLRAW